MSYKTELFYEAKRFVEGNPLAQEVLALMHTSYMNAPTSSKVITLYYFMLGYEAANQHKINGLRDWLLRFVLLDKANYDVEDEMRRRINQHNSQIKEVVLKAAANSDLGNKNPVELASQLAESFNYVDQKYSFVPPGKNFDLECFPALKSKEQ